MKIKHKFVKMTRFKWPQGSAKLDMNRKKFISWVHVLLSSMSSQTDPQTDLCIMKHLYINSENTIIVDCCSHLNYAFHLQKGCKTIID